MQKNECANRDCEGGNLTNINSTINTITLLQEQIREKINLR